MDEREKHEEEDRRLLGCSESYLSAMKRRLNLQTIGAYIRDGIDICTISKTSFDQREEDAFSKLENFLTEKYNKDGTIEMISHLTTYMSVVQEVYFNLGMKAGATLQRQLTDNFETDI